MDGQRGIVGQLAGWLEYPFKSPVDFRALALVLALIIIALWLFHDGHRIAQEAAGL